MELRSGPYGGRAQACAVGMNTKMKWHLIDTAFSACPMRCAVAALHAPVLCRQPAGRIRAADHQRPQAAGVVLRRFGGGDSGAVGQAQLLPECGKGPVSRPATGIYYAMPREREGIIARYVMNLLLMQAESEHSCEQGCLAVARLRKAGRAGTAGVRQRQRPVLHVWAWDTDASLGRDVTCHDSAS